MTYIIIIIIINITIIYLSKIDSVEVTFLAMPGWPPLFTFSGRENPLASHPLWLSSAARLTLALDSLSLSSPPSCHPTTPLRPPRVAPFYINPRFVPASSPLPTGKWEWTLVQRWIDPLCNLRLAPRSPSRFHGRSFLPFHPRSASIPVAATVADDDDFSARRRTLIPISKIRLPSKPRIDWQKQRQSAPPKATPWLSFSFSAANHPWNFKESAEDRQFRFLELRKYIAMLLYWTAVSLRNYFFY